MMYRSARYFVLFLVFLSACAGNRYLIDEPPVGDAESQKAMIEGVPEVHRERLRKMLDENLRHPGNPSLLYEMGLLYQYSGKPDLAERFYRNCLQAEPRHVPSAVNLASLLTLRDRMDGAIQVLEELFSAGADDPRARTDLAILFRRTDRRDKSEEQSEYVLKHFGQLYGARLNLGMNYLDAKKYELALSVFTELTREFPQDSKSHFSLGYTYQELGDFTKARLEYEQAVSNDVSAFEAHNNLGLMHLFRQEYEKAEQSFIAAVRANVNFAAAHLNLGIAQRNLNQYPKAEKSMRKALSLKPNMREAQYDLALLYDDYWDRPDRALTAWQSYLATWEKELEKAQRKYIAERIVLLGERLERERREAAEQKAAAPAAEPPAENPVPAEEPPAQPEEREATAPSELTGPEDKPTELQDELDAAPEGVAEEPLEESLEEPLPETDEQTEVTDRPDSVKGGQDKAANAPEAEPVPESELDSAPEAELELEPVPVPEPESDPGTEEAPETP